MRNNIEAYQCSIGKVPFEQKTVVFSPRDPVCPVNERISLSDKLSDNSLVAEKLLGHGSTDLAIKIKTIIKKTAVWQSFFYSHSKI